jgi:hypothetical protein
MGDMFSSRFSGLGIDLRRVTDMLTCSYAPLISRREGPRCTQMWTADFRRVKREGGWEFRLH